MTEKWAEMLVIGELVNQLTKAGYLLNVWDGESDYYLDEWTGDRETIFENLRTMDYDHLYARKGEDQRGGHVMLVYGNGREVISDYTICDKEFEVICDNAIDYAETLEDR